MFEKLGATLSMDQHQVQQMATKKEAMVELCHQFTETHQEQGNQIIKLISHIKALTKIISPHGTTAPQQKRRKKEKMNKI